MRNWVWKDEECGVLPEGMGDHRDIPSPVDLRNWTWHYLDLVIVLFGVIEQWMLPLYHVIYASIVGHASSATLRLWLKKPEERNWERWGWQFQDLRTGTMSLACFYLKNDSVALYIYVLRTFVDFFANTDIYIYIHMYLYFIYIYI